MKASLEIYPVNAFHRSFIESEVLSFEQHMRINIPMELRACVVEAFQTGSSEIVIDEESAPLPESATLLALLGFIHCKDASHSFSARLLAGPSSWAHTLRDGLPLLLDPSVPFRRVSVDQGAPNSIVIPRTSGSQRWLLVAFVALGVALITYLRLFR